MLVGEALPPSTGPCALAIGKFDAIHLGHQALIRSMVHEARELGLQSVVLTFKNHPNQILNPTNVPLPVIGPTQKIDLLQSLGVNHCLNIPFTVEFANQSPEQFVKKYIEQSRAKVVYVGDNFRFSKDAKGTTQTLKDLGNALGFEVRTFRVEFQNSEKISTTTIRNHILNGEIEQANSMLGRFHFTTGLVEHGRKLGRQLGYPTANLARDSEGLLPADGVYAGYLISDGVRYPAAHSIGTNDSIEAVPRLLESHVIGRDDLDLYDKTVVCEYVAQVRGWAKFESVEALTEQIASDVKRAAELLED
ncbi:MAG: riboflavin biosynthesis protein RibF [Actinomycetota bacterium]|jgi:riboflavin kinase/FMN adenylyltransferase